MILLVSNLDEICQGRSSLPHSIDRGCSVVFWKVQSGSNSFLMVSFWLASGGIINNSIHMSYSFRYDNVREGRLLAEWLTTTRKKDAQNLG
jgi:hypothetical protein